MLENVSNRTVRPSHPGEVIADTLETVNISQTQFAQMLGVSRRTVNQIIQGHRPITVDMAIRIGIAFGNGPELWLNMQQKVDIWDTMHSRGEQYQNIELITDCQFNW